MTIREILEDLINFSTHEKSCIHCKQVVDKSLSLIRTEIEKVIPKDHGLISDGLGDGTLCECDYCCAIADFKKRIGEVL